MSCFLKDHCNRLLSHCSVKGCDFFSQYDKPREGKGEGKPFWVLAIIFFRFRFFRSYRPFDQFYKTRIHFYSNDGTFRIEGD